MPDDKDTVTASVDRLERLESRQVIHDVLMRYCRAVDRLDLELLRSCYHEDSWDDHGHYKGDGHAFAEFIVTSLAERAHHTTHADWSMSSVLDPATAFPLPMDGFAQGRRDAQDPVYLPGRCSRAG